MVPCHFSTLQPIASYSSLCPLITGAAAEALWWDPHSGRGWFTTIFLCWVHTCLHIHTAPVPAHFSFKFTRGRSWDEHAQRMRGCCSSSVTSSSIRVLLTLCIYNATSTHLIRLRIYMPFLSFKTPLHFWSRPVRLWSSCISELNSSCQ